MSIPAGLSSAELYVGYGFLELLECILMKKPHLLRT
jgi:hypothetical protein